MSHDEDDVPSDTETEQSESDQGLQIMLSYQWDSQKLVEDVYNYLKKAQEIPVWMDKHGGMKENIFESMSEGVQNCSVLVCFLTPAYQNSANCKRELSYALETGTTIIPCIVGPKEPNKHWQPTDWLGMSIAGILYLDFTKVDSTNFQSKCEELLQRIQLATNTE